jgi:small subunit ribosomal protein S13
MLNRQKDLVTGEDLHLVGTDLIDSLRVDIEREKKTRSWRGIRHYLGLPVRGQRTKTSGRKGATIGVTRKKRMQ